MVKRGLRASNGFWNTSCAWRRKSRSRSPASPAIGAPAKVIAPPVGSTSFSIRRPNVVLPQPNSPTMATASPSPTSKLTPSSACTAGCAPRAISPSVRVTGKCFTTSRSSTSAAMSWDPMRLFGGCRLRRRGGRPSDGRPCRSCLHRCCTRAGQRDSAARSGSPTAAHAGRADCRRSAPAPGRRTEGRGKRCAGPSCTGVAGAPDTSRTGPLSTTWPAYITTTSSQR